MDLRYWSLKGCFPRPAQEKCIDEIQEALDSGYENIILEAGTGIGKSAIATTIARMVCDSYILTMTNQLQGQYLNDFNYMLTEIKGKRNYSCNYGGTCADCHMEHQVSVNGKPLTKCEDCEYRLAVKKAQHSKTVLTNYDYLWYAGNYANQWTTRDLLVLDETHNFEKKIMSLVSQSLNRKTIYEEYHFDIFDKVMNGGTLESIKTSEYWRGICDKLIDSVTTKIDVNCSSEAELKRYTNQLNRYSEIKMNLDNDDWIIETPNKYEILNDTHFREVGRYKGLTVDFKPLMINEYSDKLLQFGRHRLFLTGTLGNKQRFCHWNGLDNDDTYYLYMKSPFPVKYRPIIKDYVKNMSGFKDKVPNWKSDKAIKEIKRIIGVHKDTKGVIHTSSNQQAWWIKKQLDSKRVWVVQGDSRAETIANFEESDKPITLVGAGIKDGVDFKGDKCRYQILFKMPKPSIGSAQVLKRAKLDPVWYAYQTIMDTMQSYGRGIRDESDYCTYYILDSDFENFISKYGFLFNDYFKEAIQ